MVAEWRRHNRGAMAPMKIFLSVAANGATVFSTMTFHRGTRISKEGPSSPLLPSCLSCARQSDPDFSFCRPARLPIMIKSPRQFRGTVSGHGETASLSFATGSPSRTHVWPNDCYTRTRGNLWWKRLRAHDLGCTGVPVHCRQKVSRQSEACLVSAREDGTMCLDFANRRFSTCNILIKLFWNWFLNRYNEILNLWINFRTLSQ